MPETRVEEAYRDAGPLVHTLGLRLLGSVDEAEALVRRVFASAVASESPLERRALVQAATMRVADEVSARARSRLGDVQGTIEGFAQAVTVEAEAERLLLRDAVDALDPRRRDALERVLIHGDSAFEFALMTGLSEQDVADELAAALADLWDGAPSEPPHAPLTEVAHRVLGEPGSPGWDAHLAACEVCQTLHRRVSDLVAAISRLPVAGPVVAPRPGLWEDVETAIACGEGCESDDAGAGQAPARRGSRRVLATALGVAVLVLIGLSVVLVEQLLARDEGEVIAAALLTDPRTGVESGTAAVVDRDGRRVLIVQGPFVEAVESFYELWLVDDDGSRVSLGPLAGAEHETDLPSVAHESIPRTVEITREPWDGDPESSGDVVARGELR